MPLTPQIIFFKQAFDLVFQTERCFGHGAGSLGVEPLTSPEVALPFRASHSGVAFWQGALAGKNSTRTGIGVMIATLG